MDNLHEGVPKSLQKSYEAAQAQGVYSGTVTEWCRVQYLLYRLSLLKVGREPASYGRWLYNTRLADKQREEG